MKLLLRVAFICCGVFFIVDKAAAQSPWYLSGSAGVFLRSDASKLTTIYNTNLGLIGPGTNTATFDPGPVFDLAVGYKLPLGFRVEGELGYAHDVTSGISPVSTNGTFPNLVGNRLTLQSGGNHDDYSAMVNAFYDFPLSGRFVAYAGLGAGVIYGVAQTGVFAGPAVTGFVSRGGHVLYPAIQAELGLTVAIDPAWAVVPSYRYEHGFGSGTIYPINANIIKLGLRYNF